MENLELYRELAVAVVAQACEDYIYAKRALIYKNRRPDYIKRAQKIVDENIEFFHSDRYKLFSNNMCDWDKLIAKLDEFANDKDRKIFKFF